MEDKLNETRIRESGPDGQKLITQDKIVIKKKNGQILKKVVQPRARNLALDY